MRVTAVPQILARDILSLSQHLDEVSSLLLNNASPTLAVTRFDAAGLVERHVELSLHHAPPPAQGAYIAPLHARAVPEDSRR